MSPVEAEGGCVPAGASTFNPQRWAKALDDINGHQVAAGKRLESLDEQLMLIIPVTAVTIRVGIVTVGGSNVLSSIHVLGHARKTLLELNSTLQD
ncbi:hypothetical protein L195_g038971 [Trifolium pratense]|uniref:Uncharacterized protein n=1 Tax=Trifolium pratense TaxID=57577 RepID=A0A2K3LWN2_TRIPR|nr:hypothetical protein L195_g038971 [Trifolium pratense]